MHEANLDEGAMWPTAFALTELTPPKRHGLPVRTLLVLLHRGADSRKLTGLYERGFPGEPFDAALRYRVLRVWEVSAAAWLSGGLGLAPLAPLGNVQKADLPAVVAQM